MIGYGTSISRFSPNSGFKGQHHFTTICAAKAFEQEEGVRILELGLSPFAPVAPEAGLEAAASPLTSQLFQR